MFENKRTIVKLSIALIFFITAGSTDDNNNIDESQNAIAGQLDIALGRLAAPGQFRYIVSIEVNGEHIASGVIINEEAVLTTAAQLSTVDPANIVVRVGSNIVGQGVAYGVSRLVIHEHFQTKNNYDDIALIQLNKKLENIQNVGAVRVGRTFLGSGDKVLAIGWGEIIEHRRSQHLQFKYVFVKPVVECTLSVRPAPINPLAQLCVDENYLRSGLVAADYGGPLIYNQQVVALQSFVRKNQSKKRVYVRVSYYAWWIQRHLASMNIRQNSESNQ